jgi:Cu(I)/Ag(I) efflux system membrane protein CusA/SilA
MGTGADVMKRVAAPMVGGLTTSFLMELLFYPASYMLWKWHPEMRHAATEPADPANGASAAAVLG